VNRFFKVQPSKSHLEIERERETKIKKLKK
jgi:hypothetical protein